MSFAKQSRWTLTQKGLTLTADLVTEQGQLAVGDWIAVYDLIARYCWCLDEAKVSEWLALWTDDAEFVGAYDHVLTGKDQIVTAATMPRELEGRMRHHAANLVARYDGSTDRVVVDVYNAVSVWGGGGSLVMALSRFSLRRCDAVWKIARNELRLLWDGEPITTSAGIWESVAAAVHHP